MIRSDIRKMRSYSVPEHQGLIKLDAMENPYLLPEALQQDLATHLSKVAINRYPDSSMLSLREQIAKRDGVNANQILLGNGSDELIQLLLLSAESGTCVVPSPTFVMYKLITKWLQRQISEVPLAKDFSLNAKDVLHVCVREKASIVFLACPNNPTGNLWDQDEVTKIAKNFGGLVVIDEAYLPFSDHQFLDLISHNVIISRTFSKMGMAGLRLGYLIADPSIIDHLNKIRMPYNINVLTQAAASFLLKHSDVFDAQIKDICENREKVFQSLHQLTNIDVYPSKSNFLTFRCPDANATFETLKSNGLLIKNLHGSHPSLKNCLRVTIGTNDENDYFLQLLTEATPA
ncbi:MAG: histidinol-phosphate transaminase [Mariprofundaceae bacterium]|nr:histidinol-phosphate transaminase [Mariprofundaceae bacterium]